MAKKILAFANRKGGSGKTTSAVNVAARLAEIGGGRVLLVDIDPQGNAAEALGVDPNGRCLSQMLLGQADLRDVILPAGPNRPNLFIVPASDRLRDATTQLVAMEVARRFGSNPNYSLDNVLSEVFAPYVDLFEYIVVDCPPTIGLLDTALYNWATDVIVPVKMAYLDTAGARKNLEDVLAARDNGAKIRISHVLPTFYRPREVVAKETFDQLRQVYGRLVALPVPQTAVIEQSQAVGQLTVFEYAPESAAAQSYDHLTRRIMT
jgi:chromosome partitioning protein